MLTTPAVEASKSLPNLPQTLFSPLVETENFDALFPLALDGSSTGALGSKGRFTHGVAIINSLQLIFFAFP